MTLVHSDDWLTIHQGDCREVMAGMEPESVHCVVTSPPYWGLRDYGTAEWVGGAPECDHQDPKKRDPKDRRASTLGGGVATVAAQDAGARAANACRKCGAQRQDRQLGLEATPEEYVTNMVDVFREVRRVLRADGTLWLNLGDSYNVGTNAPRRPSATAQHGYWEKEHDDVRRAVPNLKPKDLVGIPWRVAFALQADGWYLRSDIIWSKPNPMPESVTDRPTKAHEYVFLLSRSARYWYDADAVRVPHARLWDETNGGSWSAGKGDAQRVAERGKAGTHSGAYPVPNELGANLRTVWTVATQPYPGAHFATFPEKLIEPPIKAGCPEGGTVLDPFGGSGTVARVANRLSRRAVLIDLNGDYIRQQFDRNRELPLGLVDGDAA